MGFRSTRSMVLGFVALLACACGSDSNSGSVNSGVDDSKPVNMLTADDGQKVCTAVAQYAASRLSQDTVRKTVCVVAAAVQPTGMPPTVDECNTSVQKCLSSTQQTGTTTPVGTVTPTCTAGVVTTTCMATVGELQGCATALIDQSASFVNGINCDLYGLSPAEISKRLQPDTSIPAACTAVQQSCPGFLPAQQSAPAPSSS